MQRSAQRVEAREFGVSWCGGWSGASPTVGAECGWNQIEDLLACRFEAFRFTVGVVVDMAGRREVGRVGDDERPVDVAPIDAQEAGDLDGDESTDAVPAQTDGPRRRERDELVSVEHSEVMDRPWSGAAVPPGPLEGTHGHHRREAGGELAEQQHVATASVHEEERRG